MPPRGASRSLWCQEVSLAPSLPQGWSEHGRARLGSTEAHRVPVPIPGTGIARKPPGCPTRFPARDFPLGFTCSWLWAPGWESGRPAGTGDDYSHFPALLTPRSRFRFLNPHPSIFFVVFFGGEGSLAKGWCLLQGPLSCSGRPTWVPAACPMCGAALCFWVPPVPLTRGPYLGGARDHRGADQGTRGVPCTARRGPCLHALAKFANSALVLQIAFSSCIPYGTSVPGLGQLWGEVFLPQPTPWAELYPVRCRILRLRMPRRGPAVPAPSPHRWPCVLSWAGRWACP